MAMKSNDDAVAKITAKIPVGPAEAIELFVFVNLAFLTVDIYLAHSINEFALNAEWIPFYFSIVGSILLLVGMAKGKLNPNEPTANILGHIVGWGSIATGIAGMILHLESRFFEEMTLKSLVYAAPFVAPLSYTGVGLLLVMNRMVKFETKAWSQWVMILTLGGFAGNFVLSVLDHAQNGFYEWTEWIPVASAALAVGVLVPMTWEAVTKEYMKVVLVVMLLQMVIGTLGFYLHGVADLAGPAAEMWDNFVFGAPIFAPLLFCNIALLGLIGLWACWECAKAEG
ncbi:hypothetical protein JD969_05495 [Planctomycetota bacterium]|nr:hypothetical protein JD969_05495 [Planctomycetota bacterium]